MGQPHDHNVLTPSASAGSAGVGSSPLTLADIRGKVDFGILTIRDDEFDAVLVRFPPFASIKGRRIYNLHRLHLSQGGSYMIAIVRCIEQGNTEALDAARDLLEELNPQWLIVVGIAGAVPSDEFTLGDVVVSTRIQDFSVEAVLQDKAPEFAMMGGPIHKDVATTVANLRAQEAALRGWNSESSIGVPRPTFQIDPESFYGDEKWQEKTRAVFSRHAARSAPIVTSGAIGSSDRLIKDTKILATFLLVAARQVIAVEMESAGVYRGAMGRQVPSVAIRGISDVVGFKRDPGWTRYACHTAAAFTYAFLRTRPIEPRDCSTGGRVEQRTSIAAVSVPSTDNVAVLEHARAQRRYVESRLGDYIDPGAHLRDGSEFDIRTWMASREETFRVTYVTGEYGCGKTTFCYRWLALLCGEYECEKNGSCLPILVNLTDLDVSRSSLDAIPDDHPTALTSLFELFPPVVSPPPASSLPYVVFWEGLDELESDATSALLARILAFASYDTHGHRFVISSRINSLRLHVHNLKLIRSGIAGQRYLPSRLNTIEIPHLDTPRKKEFLRLRIPATERRDRIIDYLYRTPNLHELVSRPLIMDLLTDSSLGEEPVLERLMTAGLSDSEMSVACVFDAVVQHHFDRLKHADESQRVERLKLALSRIAYRQLESPAITRATILDELEAAGVEPGKRADYAMTILNATFLRPHPVLPGRFTFQFRAYRDYFIALYLARLPQLQAAVREHADHLQDFFCHRGILDFLREMVGEPHKAYLRELLRGTTEQMVLASHLTRRACFRDMLEQIEAAFQRCETKHGQVFLVFSILSHIDHKHPRYLEYSRFIQENALPFREALKLFVEGVEKDVLAFNLERLNHPHHRRKAPLYLLSLSDPEIFGIDPIATRNAVRHFIDHGRPTFHEVELGQRVLAMLLGATTERDSRG